MLREQRRLLCHQRWEVGAQSLGNLAMILLPDRREQGLIHYFLGEAVLEGVETFRPECGFTEELGSL